MADYSDLLPGVEPDQANQMITDALKGQLSSTDSIPSTQPKQEHESMLPAILGAAAPIVAKGLAVSPKLGMFFAAHPNVIKEAQRMAREGADRKHIWEDLNTWQGPDKFWRTEKFSPPMAEPGLAPPHIQRWMDIRKNLGDTDPDFMRDYWGLEHKNGDWMFNPEFTGARRIANDPRIISYPGSSETSTKMSGWMNQPHVYKEAPWLEDMPVWRDARNDPMGDGRTVGGLYFGATPSLTRGSPHLLTGTPSVWINPNIRDENPNHIINWHNDHPSIGGEISHDTGWNYKPTVTQHEAVHALQDAYGWSATSPSDWISGAGAKPWERPDVGRSWKIYNEELRNRADKLGKPISDLPQEERDAARKATSARVYWNSANEIEARDAPNRERMYENLRFHTIRGEDAAKDWARDNPPFKTQDVPEQDAIVGQLGLGYNPRYDYKAWGVDPRSTTGEPSNWGPEFGPPNRYTNEKPINEAVRRRLLEGK